MFANGTMPAGAEYKAALTDILQTFPYFQLAQVLFAKQMYDTHEPEASGRIKLASVYAPDRKAMYLLFKTTTDTPKTFVKEKEDVSYNFVYSSNTGKPITSTPVPTKHEIEPPVLSKKESLQTETFIKKELEKTLPVQPPAEKPIEAVPQKAEAITPEIKKPEIPVEKTYSPPAVVEKKAEVVPVADSPSIETKEEEKETLSPVNEPISDSNLKYSFSSWLKVIPEISVEKKQPTKPVSQQETSTIIDTFLKKVPTISRPKAEFFSPVKAAKMSVSEDDTIVSETLAKIYLTQGNLQKALKAYQTLLLQFPEKKNIFAARIKEITALIREHTKPATK